MNSKVLTITAMVALLSLIPAHMTLAEHRETIVYLNSDPHAHVPEWTQIKFHDFWSGCGATAWTIVYGYWKHDRHANGLFGGQPLDTTSEGQDSAAVVSATREIASHIRTYYHERFEDGGTVRVGSVQPWNMCEGLRYAREHGYPHSRCWKITGSEFDKFEHIRRYLLANRPVILNYSTEGHNSTNHFAVIEAAKRIDERVGDSWRARDVWYFVNNGHGSRLWISARQVGRNTSINTVTGIFLITVSDRRLAAASSPNQEACQEWCRDNDSCAMCAPSSGCGPGYTRIRDVKFGAAGGNWYACRRRDTERAEASEGNREACGAWCREHLPECVTCSTLRGCGNDYETMQSWTGRGNNWHACKRRAPSDFERASGENAAACRQWCDARRLTCVHCTTLRGCGPDLTTLRSWTGEGRNWHACGLSERQAASQNNESGCRAYCNLPANQCRCSTRYGCGAGEEMIRSWKGEGINWHACQSRDSASEDNHRQCLSYCATLGCFCSTRYGCGRGNERIRSWTGYGTNWHACRAR